jgi:Tryptophan-associated transmembrane protein (Trp_oprn_chp)
LSRLRPGEVVAGLGAVALLVVLFADWFQLETGTTQGDGASTTGWASLGWLLAGLLALTALVALWLVVATVVRGVIAAVAAGVATTALATVASPALLARIVTQPDLGVGAPNDLVAVRFAAWVGLVCTLLILVGALVALRDERLDAPQSAYEPPEPRPAPRPHSS